VCTDACKKGLGGVLTQKDHVVCYESRKLKEQERNYVAHDLELESIIHALKMWRHYLMGRKIELMIDNCGLKHLFGQPTLNARQTRWLEFISECDFEIKHISGKENQVVDALSRRAHEMHIATINM
jgi:ribonuclease HI